MTAERKRFHPRILYEIRQELVEPLEILFTTSLKSSTYGLEICQYNCNI